MGAVGYFISSSLLLMGLSAEGETWFVQGTDHNTATLGKDLQSTTKQYYAITHT